MKNSLKKRGGLPRFSMEKGGNVTRFSREFRGIYHLFLGKTPISKQFDLLISIF